MDWEVTMKDNYVFEYLNENDFRVKERSVRKYNMLAYKKMMFEYYPKLKQGEFLGVAEKIKMVALCMNLSYQLMKCLVKYMV